EAFWLRVWISANRFLILAGTRRFCRYPEMGTNHRRDVSQRPFLGRRAPAWPCTAPEQRPERVRAVQRAMAAATDMVGASPIHELVPGSRGQQHVAGSRTA